MGGHFVANLYIAYKVDGKLAIGSLQFKGAALKDWMEFRKTSKKAVYDKAITVTGATKGKKGSIVYQTPTFKLSDISEASNANATEVPTRRCRIISRRTSRARRIRQHRCRPTIWRRPG